MNILIIASASVSIYKTCEIIRLFKKNGHTVNVALTPNAANLISPNLFDALADSVFVTESGKMEHISLERKADIMLVAPATASLIGHITSGIGGNLALDILLAKSKHKQVYLAPAMNCEMWENPIVQENIAKLELYGFKIIHPAIGDLACGENGVGKLADPEFIYNTIIGNLPLSGMNILMTAGGTIERIDDVRYISNFSSGTQAQAICNVLSSMGANVHIIAGNTKCKFESSKNVINVESARDMLSACKDYIANNQCDIFIAAAAVGDFRPSQKQSGKIKKNNISSIELIKNDDILATISFSKMRPRIVIGFAAESDNILENARRKKIDKNCDIVIANELVFGSDNTRGFIISNVEEKFECTKIELARKLALHIVDLK